MFAHPSLPLLSGTFSREDLFLVVYCLVDDWMKHAFGTSNAPRPRRSPGPAEFSDAEVLCVVLVGELCHCPRERAWLRQVRASYHGLFPHLPETSRFHRRAVAARFLLRRLRAALLGWADADLEPLRILDGFPVPLCACWRIRDSNQPIEGSAFGYCSAKRRFFFGLSAQLLVTLSGFVVDLCLTPGHWHDSKAAACFLDQCEEQGVDLRGQAWLMDKGYCYPKLVAAARERLGLTLLVRAYDPKTGPPTSWQLTLDAQRRRIEGLISVLTDHFSIQRILATTGMGVFRRVEAKATAWTLARYLNRCLALPDLDIARYAV